MDDFLSSSLFAFIYIKVGHQHIFYCIGIANSSLFLGAINKLFFVALPISYAIDLSLMQQHFSVSSF